MMFNINRVVFPDGDYQDIPHKLRINQLVDINGYPLRLPLPSSKMIVYEVFKIQTKTTRNEKITEYHLDLMDIRELKEHVGRRMPQYGF